MCHATQALEIMLQRSHSMYVFYPIKRIVTGSKAVVYYAKVLS